MYGKSRFAITASDAVTTVLFAQHSCGGHWTHHSACATRNSTSPGEWFGGQAGATANPAGSAAEGARPARDAVEAGGGAPVAGERPGGGGHAVRPRARLDSGGRARGARRGAPPPRPDHRGPLPPRG